MARLPANLECPDGSLEPGGRLQCRLLVYNADDRVDNVTPRVQGPLAPWTTVTPPRIGVMPRTEQAFDVMIDLPEDAQVEAGDQPLLIEVRSGLEGTEPSVEEADIVVGRHTSAELSLRTRSARGHEQALEAHVRNLSNHPVTVHLEVDARVRTTVRPAVLQLAAFGADVSRITAYRESDDDAPVNLVVRATGTGIDAQDAITWRGGTVHALPLLWIAGAGALLVLGWLLWLVDPFGWFGGESDADGGTVATEPTASAPVALEPDVDDFPVLTEREDRQLRSPWEATVQSMLVALGYELGEPGVDGRFGPLTTAATLEFQEAEGLDVDGTVDAPDWERLLRIHRDEGDPTAVRNWHEKAARELARLLGVQVEVVGTECGDIDEVVGAAQRRNGTVELTMASTQEPPC